MLHGSAYMLRLYVSGIVGLLTVEAGAALTLLHVLGTLWLPLGGLDQHSYEEFFFVLFCYVSSCWSDEEVEE